MRTMASVRTEEPLPPNIRDCSVVRNNGDPVDGGYQNPLPFQPLVVCLRFLGIELDPALLYKSSKCFRYLLLGLCFLLLNAFFTIFTAVSEHNFFVQIYNMDTPTNSSSVENKKNSTVPSVLFWNLIVDYVNYGVLSVGVHASLLFFSRQKEWKFLWDKVQQILQHHNEFKGIRKSIRRVTIAGLVIACLVIHKTNLIIITQPLYKFNCFCDRKR